MTYHGCSSVAPYSVVVMSLDDLRNVIGRDDPVFCNFRNPSFWFKCEAIAPSGNGHVLVLDWGCVQSYIGFGALQFWVFLFRENCSPTFALFHLDFEAPSNLHLQNLW